MADPALQKFALKTLLALPSPILRAMSGGGVIYKAGRTLDPAFQFLAAQARSQPPMSSVTAVEARLATRAGVQLVSGPVAPGVRWEPLTLSGPNGAIPNRVYRPERQDPDAPALVFMHFGGGVIGDLDTCHSFCTQLAKTTAGPVISVDYRLAPEHKHPAGFEDCLAVYRHVRDNTAEFGAAPGRVAVGGDSMGGYFSALITQALKRNNEGQPVYQLLIYPALDVASDTPSMTLFGDAFPLTSDTMHWFMAQYLGPDANPSDPTVSPARAEDLSGLAPAIIATAGFDPLTDEGEAYAKALIAAGVPVVFRRFDNLPHAFTAYGVVAAAEAACQTLAELARDAGRGRPASA